MSADFIDSNVFVYLFDSVNRSKQAQAKKIVKEGLEKGSGVISYQVVQETLNVLTRKLKPPLPGVDAGRFLDTVLSPMWRVMPSAELFNQGLSLQSRFSLSFYDSMIVAAAQEAGCKRLISEDMQHGLIIDKLKVVNPFLV